MTEIQDYKTRDFKTSESQICSFEKILTMRKAHFALHFPQLHQNRSVQCRQNLKDNPHKTNAQRTVEQRRKKEN